MHRHERIPYRQAQQFPQHAQPAESWPEGYEPGRSWSRLLSARQAADSRAELLRSPLERPAGEQFSERRRRAGLAGEGRLRAWMRRRCGEGARLVLVGDEPIKVWAHSCQARRRSVLGNATANIPAARSDAPRVLSPKTPRCRSLHAFCWPSPSPDAVKSSRNFALFPRRSLHQPPSDLGYALNPRSFSPPQ